MVKRKTLLLLSAFLCASVATRASVCTINDEPLVIMAQTLGSLNDKSEIPISASIDGHALTIYINENVGIAHIVVTNKNGVYIDRDNLFHTPDVATLLIDDAGFYTVTITLHNGDVYTGDFMVTE